MNATDPGISNGLLELGFIPGTTVATAAAGNLVKGGALVGGVNQTAYGCWVSANGLAALLAPAQGTFPNLTKSTLQGAPFSEVNLSLTKDTKIRERLTAQFRAEFYNVLNTPIFQGASGTITSSTFGKATSTPNTSNPISGNGGPRIIQFGLKFIF